MKAACFREPSRLPALGLAALCLAIGGHCADTNAPAWQSLFNGKDLTGWVPVHDVTFEVKDGNLRLVKCMGWLRTEKQYRDFILEFEWRALVPQYDSGVFLRAGLEGKPWPKDGWQVNLRYDMLGGLVKGYAPVVPAETPRMPLNQWVKFRLEVKGRQATLDVDGERAWETDKLDALKGYLGIQAEDKAFDFRNLRLQELQESRSQLDIRQSPAGKRRAPPGGNCAAPGASPARQHSRAVRELSNVEM